MSLILGIDAAWTGAGSSGVALLQAQNGQRRILAAEPSYADFIQRAEGHVVDLCQTSGAPDVGRLLRACTVLSGASVDVAAIDMPISRRDISGRRFADDAISREFGAAWASTHSPSANRPGPLGKRITEDFERAGFTVATTAASSHNSPSLIEAYPLAALVRIMGLAKRPPYKVKRMRRYWPRHSPVQRMERLLDQWRAIYAALADHIVDLPVAIPEPHAVTASSLKPFEDVLDATICALVGARYLEGTIASFGDEDAAIWVPTLLDG